MNEERKIVNPDTDSASKKADLERKEDIVSKVKAFMAKPSTQKRIRDRIKLLQNK